MGFMTVDPGSRARIQQLAADLRARHLPPPADLRTIRRSAGATHQDIAAAVGVSALTAQNWEQGKHRPHPRHAAAYRLVLDLLVQLAQEPGGGAPRNRPHRRPPRRRRVIRKHVHLPAGTAAR